MYQHDTSLINYRSQKKRLFIWFFDKKCYRVARFLKYIFCMANCGYTAAICPLAPLYKCAKNLNGHVI